MIFCNTKIIFFKYEYYNRRSLEFGGIWINGHVVKAYLVMLEINKELF